jgi:hypothetical protein
MISNQSIKSARSGNSNSSNGSSLEKEIFGSIPNNFNESQKADEQGRNSSSTNDSSEAINV